MPSRRTEPDSRVMVFVDGQNLFKACERSYGRGQVHPIALARRLALGRRLVGTRYYSGIHDPRKQPRLNAAAHRRHALIRRSGVTVVERQLRYRWEWGLDAAPLGPPADHVGETRTIEVTPYERPREKGVDLALGLDVVDLALRGLMDVAMIVSSDTDLTEVARTVHNMTRATGRVSVEAAVVSDARRPVLLKHYDFTNQVRRIDFEECRDEFDYRRSLDPTTIALFLQTLTRES
jgi:uncharacterized LabA/DUF88 family protein